MNPLMRIPLVSTLFGGGGGRSWPVYGLGRDEGDRPQVYNTSGEGLVGSTAGNIANNVQGVTKVTPQVRARRPRSQQDYTAAVQGMRRPTRGQIFGGFRR